MSIHLNPGDIDLLEKLALGLLVHPGSSPVSKPRLFLGKIPEHFPIEIPISEQNLVIGTLARSETQIEIVLEGNLTPEEVFSFYRAQLTSQGWHEPENLRSQGGGFIHSSIGPYEMLTFCQESSGAGLTLHIVSIESATTMVRLNLSLDRSRNPCKPRASMQNHRKLQGMIPRLVPPPGAQQHGGSGGSSSDEAHTTTTLTTHLALDALTTHYADQLTQAGWTKTNTGASGPVAWSSWHFTSEEQEPWSGLLFILKTPEKPDDYFLYVRVTWSKPASDQKLTDWFSNSSTFSIG